MRFHDHIFGQILGGRVGSLPDPLPVRVLINEKFATTNSTTSRTMGIHYPKNVEWVTGMRVVWYQVSGNLGHRLGVRVNS